MPVYSSQELLDVINRKLSDETSAYWGGVEMLECLLDITESCLPIVQNEFNIFYNDIKIPTLHVQDSILFNDGKQTIPYKGSSSISHASLSGLLEDDAHPQYFPVSGGFLEGNLGVQYGSYINSSLGSGDHGRGITFRQPAANQDSVVLGRNTVLKFDSDNSTIYGVGGTVNAWISFDSTTQPLTVKTSYNVDTIQQTSVGKYVLHFNDPIIGNYMVFSNSIGNESGEATFLKSVSSVRKQDRCSLVVRNIANKYLNAKINDVVVISTN